MQIKVKVGCDIVKKNKFLKFSNQKIVLNLLFTKLELIQTNSLESLIGLFSAKEAVLKALEIKPGNWHSIEILKHDNGKPYVNIYNNSYNGIIISQDITISHDGDYVFAVACFLVK